MIEKGVRPNHFTFPFLVKECSQRVDMKLGGSIHAHIVEIGFDKDPFVQNSLISMYASCGDLKCARRVFDEMCEPNVVSWNSLLIGCLRLGELDLAMDIFMKMEERNVRTWNSIITGFVQGGRAKEALDFFHEMLISGDDKARPDKITIASVISACATLGALDQGKWVHSYLKRNGLECDMVIKTALVDMYGKCGCVERAVEVFKELDNKDVFAWTAMISVFALHGLGEEAFDLYREMKGQGTKPNHVTFVGLLSACAHSGLVEKARWCFNVMQHVYSIKPLVHHYACMVDILGRAGLFEEAEGLIASMPMEPDVFVWGALLGSCRMHGNVELGERVAQHLIGLEPLNHAFYVILSDIYAKAKRFDDLKRIRTSMEERGIKKTVPGCSMIEVDGIVHEFSVGRSLEDEMGMEIEWILTGINGEIKIGGDGPSSYHEFIDTVT
ncbi:Pentatricopeptide repeat-containing protein [Thalictrum thalictroides]|uniref:Pentatricopeptide repeat-containing protein n=1 Tax=Thalictrum thalictroides TaxID=46969 RepID=A0A7J6W684_THATH|nr:Pentatricopeptide repeat-containing protein [Thalictrum thalictroides]